MQQKIAIKTFALVLALSGVSFIHSAVASQTVSNDRLAVDSLNETETVQHPLQAYVNQLKTFSANFKQVTPESELFQSPVKTGVFELHRPGQLVWEYQKPMGQKILIDGENLWVYDQDLEQLTIRPLSDVQADIPLSWLLFDEKIEERFDILSAGTRNGAQWYNLQPKEATYFQSIEVALKNHQMVEVWMYAGPEDITKVTFSNIASNQTLTPDAFRLQVPESTDIIGQPQ
ncbi:LolA family protein [Thiomicrorhabdus indica]|uniref:LolA family protein n=1 Tax=Thiomicrorhabdus indica TaxID=2267253 RepID=UPI00102DCF63|nr:outer membrane lipoprotein carrier protein LolA [Thiomicrorhabdus indica]